MNQNQFINNAIQNNNSDEDYNQYQNENTTNFEEASQMVPYGQMIQQQQQQQLQQQDENSQNMQQFTNNFNMTRIQNNYISNTPNNEGIMCNVNELSQQLQLIGQQCNGKYTAMEQKISNHEQIINTEFNKQQNILDKIETKLNNQQIKQQEYDHKYKEYSEQSSMSQQYNKEHLKSNDIEIQNQKNKLEKIELKFNIQQKKQEEHEAKYKQSYDQLQLRQQYHEEKEKTNDREFQNQKNILDKIQQILKGQLRKQEENESKQKEYAEQNSQIIKQNEEQKQTIDKEFKSQKNQISEILLKMNSLTLISDQLEAKQKEQIEQIQLMYGKSEQKLLKQSEDYWKDKFKTLELDMKTKIQQLERKNTLLEDQLLKIENTQKDMLNSNEVIKNQPAQTQSKQKQMKKEDDSPNEDTHKRIEKNITDATLKLDTLNNQMLILMQQQQFQIQKQEINQIKKKIEKQPANQIKQIQEKKEVIKQNKSTLKRFTQKENTQARVSSYKSSNTQKNTVKHFRKETKLGNYILTKINQDHNSFYNSILCSLQIKSNVEDFKQKLQTYIQENSQELNIKEDNLIQITEQIRNNPKQVPQKIMQLTAEYLQTPIQIYRNRFEKNSTANMTTYLPTQIENKDRPNKDNAAMIVAYGAPRQKFYNAVAHKSKISTTDQGKTKIENPKKSEISSQQNNNLMINETESNELLQQRDNQYICGCQKNKPFKNWESLRGHYNYKHKSGIPANSSHTKSGQRINNGRN